MATGMALMATSTTCAYYALSGDLVSRREQKTGSVGRVRRCGNGLSSLRRWTSRLPSVGQVTKRASTSKLPRIEAQGLQYLFEPQDAKRFIENGYAVIDIRDESQFKEAHITGSKHIPLYILNTDTDTQTNIQRIVHQYGFQGLFFGVPFTKESDKFLPSVESEFPDKETKILVVCQKGLRSGRAATQLEMSGYSNVAYLTKGLASAPAGLFSTEGTMELKDAGRQGLQSLPPQVPAALLAALCVAAFFELTGAFP
eukprot:TRINITY_DN19053_c0_g1_i1.p1 TRINITY_DN19053_c0_g1~~TRINITY_DN19053_c0_g1_i1.p1  ORF type:complete len:264 (-),score=39.60 TRINITY_DN19053_c0_g1_i1:531-1298(-)